MYKNLIAAAAIAAAIALPNVASADPNAAGGAASGALVGAGAGFLVGGPIGAAVGAGIGGTVGAGAASTTPQREVVIEQPAASTVRERSCVRDAAGNVVCQEIRR
jgi:hypothetical protein